MRQVAELSRKVSCLTGRVTVMGNLLDAEGGPVELAHVFRLGLELGERVARPSPRRHPGHGRSGTCVRLMAAIHLSKPGPAAAPRSKDRRRPGSPSPKEGRIIMSTDQTAGHPGAEVVPLRATDASTEIHTAEAAGLAYVDVSDGRPARKPIIPAHLREGDGLGGLHRGVRRHLHHQTVRHGHAAVYHGVRSPRYITLMLAWAVVGLFRISGRILAWWHATDLYQLEHQAAADGLLTEHLRIHKQGRDTRTARGIMLAVCAVLLAVAGLAAVEFAPLWSWLLLGLVAVPILARRGRPAGKPIVRPASSRRRSRHRPRT